LDRAVQSGHSEFAVEESLMKALLSRSLALAVALCFTLGSRSDDSKPVTLKGQVMCAKCELKEAKKCTTVIVVKEDGKEVTYYFKDKGASEEHHEPVCGGGKKEASVTGLVAEDKGKKWITPTKVEYVKN
jgi:hypothetical protein